MENSLTKKEYSPEELLNDFLGIYGGEKDSVRIFASPARINIIGEHIDYNGGKVFPACINRYLYVAIMFSAILRFVTHLSMACFSIKR